MICVKERVVTEGSFVQSGDVVYSVKDILEIVLGQDLDILLACGTKAVKQVIKVGLRELSGVLESGSVRVNVVVLLDGLNNVALALELEELLSHHDVRVIEGNGEVAEISIDSTKVGRVAIGTLIVGDGPLGSGHDAQVAVSLWVHGRHERVLREVGALH